MSKTSFMLGALAVLAAFASLFGAHVALASPDLLLLSAAVATPVPNGIVAAIRRLRQKAVFDNVVAGSTARHRFTLAQRSIIGVILKLGGTTFDYSKIDAIRLTLDGKTKYEVTGAHLYKHNSWRGIPQHASFLPVMFSLLDMKSFAHEFVGAVPLHALTPSDGPLQLEVDIASSASAPTLVGEVIYGTQQDNPNMLQLVKSTFSYGTSGDFYPEFALGGATLVRQFIHYAGTDWGATAASKSGDAGNTGNGTVGTVTVGATAKVGTHRIVMVEPGSNVGTFVHIDPDGVEVGQGVVAAAYTGGGLSFTIADGATDFIAGDAFSIVIADSEGNVNEVEVSVNDVPVLRQTDMQARFEQSMYGKIPQASMFVVDHVVDRHLDAGVPTAGQKVQNRWNLTASDSFTAYSLVLADIRGGAPKLGA